MESFSTTVNDGSGRTSLVAETIHIVSGGSQDKLLGSKPGPPEREAGCNTNYFSMALCNFPCTEGRYRHFPMVVRTGRRFRFIEVDMMVVKMDTEACRRGRVTF
jgi:hypothetical protein